MPLWKDGEVFWSFEFNRRFIFLKSEYTKMSIFWILKNIFVLSEESRYDSKLGKTTLHKIALILLGIGIVIFLMGLSIDDNQRRVENGNAIVGAFLGIVSLIMVYLGFYSGYSTVNLK